MSKAQHCAVAAWHACALGEANSNLALEIKVSTFPPFDCKGKEEERRLLYVACTRASDHLVVTWSPDKPGRKMSPFLKVCAALKLEHSTHQPLGNSQKAGPGVKLRQRSS